MTEHEPTSASREEHRGRGTLVESVGGLIGRLVSLRWHKKMRSAPRKPEVDNAVLDATLYVASGQLAEVNQPQQPERPSRAGAGVAEPSTTREEGMPPLEHDQDQLGDGSPTKQPEAKASSKGMWNLVWSPMPWVVVMAVFLAALVVPTALGRTIPTPLDAYLYYLTVICSVLVTITFSMAAWRVLASGGD